MTTFEAKAAPTDEKLRGGYYTPAPIAEFVSGWVAEAGSRLLNPRAATATFWNISPNARRRRLPMECFPTRLRRQPLEPVRVEIGDYFEWFTAAKHGTFDGVAGNPPSFGSVTGLSPVGVTRSASCLSGLEAK
jgi:hypothetical protein